MSEDIVTRLREAACAMDQNMDWPLMEEAADALESALRSKAEWLRSCGYGDSAERMAEAATTIATLRAEVEGMRRDAAIAADLIAEALPFCMVPAMEKCREAHNILTGTAAIDAAMEATKEKG